jgi:DNA-binding response OmpR family regulator
MSAVTMAPIVEGEFAIADLLEMVLTDQGYSLLLVSNGREGLNHVAGGPLAMSLPMCDRS